MCFFLFVFWTISSGWLHSLFYLQNVFALTDMCTSWTWYLACDMQFYALMLLLLFVHARRPRVAVYMFFALLATVVALCFFVLLQHGITPK